MVGSSRVSPAQRLTPEGSRRAAGPTTFAPASRAARTTRLPMKPSAPSTAIVRPDASCAQPGREKSPVANAVGVRRLRLIQGRPNIAVEPFFDGNGCLEANDASRLGRIGVVMTDVPWPGVRKYGFERWSSLHDLEQKTTDLG